MRFGLIVSLYFVICLSQVAAQTVNNYSQTIEELAESIIGDDENEIEFETLIETLEFYVENPLNLNAAAKSELENLHILSDFQIVSLLHYRKLNSGLQTIYELRQIEGFNRVSIINLLPFVFVGPPQRKAPKISKNIAYGKHQFFLRSQWVAETPLGFETEEEQAANNFYPGNKQKWYTRYKFNYKQKIKWGITAEKDPGEAFFNKPQTQGFDFYSAHLEVNDLGLFKTLVIGDFKAKFGQGLVSWSGYGGGKSTYVMNIRKRNQGLSKYSSTDENRFFRGAGVTLTLKNIDFTVFGSYKTIDATVHQSDSITKNEYFSSFYTAGIHATTKQVAKKDVVNELVTGANLSFSKNNLSAGISGIYNTFSIPLKPTTSVENQFDFKGKNNFNYSADAQYRLNKMHFFGEAAMSESGGTALLAGALFKLSGRVQSSVLYRNYTPDYQALYSQSFAESATQNEKGLYAGIIIYPVKKWKISAYYDFFKYPWLTYQASAPSMGHEYLLQADFVANRAINMYWRFKNEVKEKDSDELSPGIPQLIPVQKLALRYHVNIALNKQWVLKNRMEWSSYGSENLKREHGFLLYQDVVYKTQQLPIWLYFRYAVFDTESYSSRIYAYESDVLYAFSVPAYYDKGIRIYGMIKYSPHKKLDIWVKIAQSWYENKQSIGSGLNEIQGNRKTDLKIQLRWTL